MLKVCLCILFPLTFFSCNTEVNNVTVHEKKIMQGQLDSLQKQIDELKSQLNPPLQANADNGAENSPSKAPEEDTAPATSNPVPPGRQKTLVKQDEKSNRTNEKSPTDTLKFYYTNGKISVIKTPLIDGRGEWLFYDLYGNETCRLSEVHLSYSESVDLKFHPNGAVSIATIHLNPGASMYFYESEITFDTNNNPGWKTTRQYPPSLEDSMKPPYYWDKKTKTWKQQEVVIEQDTPR